MNLPDTSLLSISANKICTLTINRPAKKNALTTALLKNFLSLLNAISEDKNISVLVIVGSGDVFSSGVDLKEFIDSGDEAAEMRSKRTDILRQVLEKVRYFPVPTVAVINGHALGAGAAIALSTDLALMSDEATIGFPEVALGIVPKLMVPILVDKVGSRLAVELLLTCERLPAFDAKSIGLINKVFPADTLRYEAQSLALLLSSLERDIAIDTKLTIKDASF